MPAVSLQSPGYRVEAVQQDKDGRWLFNKVWYLYFQQLSVLAGGTVSTDEENFSPDFGSALASLQQMFAIFSQGLDQKPQPDVYSAISVDDQSPAISALWDVIGELRKEIDSLKQGNLII